MPARTAPSWRARSTAAGRRIGSLWAAFLRAPQGRAVLALRESFFAVLPLYLIVVACLLALSAVRWFDLPPTLGWIAAVRSVYAIAIYCWPAALGLVFTLHLARSLGVDAVVASVLVLVLMLSFAVVGRPLRGGASDGIMGLGSVALPMVCVHLLDWLERRLPRPGAGAFEQFSPALAGSLRYRLPFMLAYALIFATFSLIFDVVQPRLGQWLASQSMLAYLVEMALLLNLLWWFGINGAAVWWLIWLPPEAAAPAMGSPVRELSFGFAYPGGSGAALALAVCLWMVCRDPTQRRLLRWITPLQIFNISEPLVFGLPVLGDRFLLLPFVLAPLAMTLLSYLAVVVGHGVEFQGQISWTTPYLINTYEFTREPLRAMLLQLACFGVAVAIYLPFVRLRARHAGNLEIGPRIALQLQTRPSLETFAERRYIGASQERQAIRERAAAVLAFVEQGRLELWYQPRVSFGGHGVVGVEALLRLVFADGRVVAPLEFLPALESAGYGPMLDQWVVRRTLVDLDALRATGFAGRVAINLTRGAIADDESYERLRPLLVGTRAAELEIELTEASFTARPEVVRERLGCIRNAGCAVVVDHFGVGYSNLALVHEIGVDRVKIDRSLLAAAGGPSGRMFYRQLCRLLQRLGLDVAAEGIETEAEGLFAAACGVGSMQGLHYGPALPVDRLGAAIAGIEARRLEPVT